METKIKECAICEDKINISDKDVTFWYSHLGKYYICFNCLESHSKTELLDFADGEGI